MLAPTLDPHPPDLLLNFGDVAQDSLWQSIRILSEQNKVPSRFGRIG